MESSFSSRRTPPAQQASETTGGTDDGPHQLSTTTEIPLIRNRKLAKLCNRCRRIDFNYYLVSPPGNYRPKPGLFLGNLKNETSCRLCRFFYSMRCPSEGDGAKEVYTLQPYRLGSESARSAAYPLSRYAHSIVFCVLPREPYLRRFGSSDSLTADGFPTDSYWIVPQSFTAAPFFSYAKPHLRALPFSSTSVNYPLLRAWCEQCDNHHSTCASVEKTTTGPVVRCIDCHTHEIVKIETSDRFFALSYVWGEQPTSGSECTIGARETASTNSVRQLPRDIPNVIEDAMIVVAGLGERYLWVDQYCIDQNDAEDKHAQIGNMASIYEGAYATIVAFSATDSASGLPGVKNLPRKPYPSISVPRSKPPLSAIRPSAITSSKLVNSSVWMTRGWTYQEAILSRRLLIFTDYQVEFICSDSVWQECIMPGTEDVTPRNRWLGEETNLLEAIAPQRRLTSGGTIHIEVEILFGYIEEYSGRHLSYQSDALNAVTGLLSRISIFTYLGIPVCNASDSITRNTLESSTNDDERIVQRNGPLRFLTYLTWYPAKGNLLSRRDAFPSWSWLGWGGRVKFPRIVRWQISAQASVWILKQATSSKAGTLVPFARLFQKLPMDKEPTSILPHISEYLWVEGPVIKMTFTVGQETSGEEFFVLRSSDPSIGTDISNPNRINFRNCNPNSKSQDAMSKRVITEDWDCLLLVTRELLTVRRGCFLILDQDRRNTDTEAEDNHYNVVGSADLRILPEDSASSLDDPSLRRRVKLG